MSLVIAPAASSTCAVAVAPLRHLHDDAIVTALDRSELRARYRSAEPRVRADVAWPADLSGEVVMRDGTRLRFGPEFGWIGVWLHGALAVQPALNLQKDREISLAALAGGRVELWLDA